MAQLFIAKGWTPPDALALDLEENLPERWTVVVGPTVWGATLDGVVVTPHGLAVLHARTGSGRNDGAAQSLPSAADAARTATRALVKYLADEFPTLHPPIANLVVLTAAGAHPSADTPADPPVADMAGLADAITDALPDAPALSADSQAMLAHMLWQRRLTRRQRAAEPFVFRGDTLAARGHAAWSLAEIAAYIDRAPEDGVYHLRNGTLARWLEAQGAPDLADVARDALRAFPLDARAALEVLLQETGVVEHPVLSVYPPRIDLGAMVAGSERTASFRIQQRGRGYLFGALYTNNPWLYLEDDTFAGTDSTVMLRADTRDLPISPRPVQGVIHLTSPVLVAPVEVPVCLHVVAQSPLFQRRFVAPVVWAVATGALGALAALVLTAVVQWPPEATRGLAVAAVALLWALAGLGAGSAVTRPTARALVRWLAGAAAWAFLLAGGAALLLGLLAALGASVPAWAAAIPVVAGACGVLAAAPGRRQAGPAEPPQRPREIASDWVRRGVVFAAVLCVAAVLVAGWQHPETQHVRQEAQEWLAARLGEADNRLGAWSDALQVRYYDRRAEPVAPGLPLPTVTPAPDNGTGQGG